MEEKVKTKYAALALSVGVAMGVAFCKLLKINHNLLNEKGGKV